VVNSQNLGARITKNGALDQKIWALEAFRVKRSYQECSRVILEFWSGWRALTQKTRPLAKFENFSVIFVDFCSVWSGLVPFCNYFSNAEGHAVTFPNAQGLRCNLEQAQGLLCKFCENMGFWNYFPTVKSVSWVQGAVD
jgi:hypothetical protein